MRIILALLFATSFTIPASAQTRVRPLEVMEMLRYADDSAFLARYPQGINGGGFTATMHIGRATVAVDFSGIISPTFGVAVSDPATGMNLVMVDVHANGSIDTAMIIFSDGGSIDTRVTREEYMEFLENIIDHLRRHQVERI